MQKGFFKTDTFTENNPSIEMENWVEPTAYNNGATDVYINGMKLKPQGIFRIGPAGVKMNGAIHLKFPDAGRNDVKVSYTILEKHCPTTPR